MDDFIAQYRDTARQLRRDVSPHIPVCWQFVRHVRADHGRETPLFKDIVKAGMDVLPVVEDHMQLIIQEPKPWSVILFECHQFDWHAGVVLPGLTQFIHLRRKHGIEITQIVDRFWSKQCRGYYDN